MIISDETAQKAADQLSQHDPILGEIIASAGLCTIRQHHEYYQALVEEIIGQQLSVKAARSIRNRFVELFNGIFPLPTAILEKSVEELRTAGLSGAKAKYIRDLAEHVLDGRLTFDSLDDMSNDEIIAKLTDVKGIGEWTAHMFLLFCMGRSDVLAVGDLGIRSGIKKLYDFENLPTPVEITELATKNQWHPYESIACWYIWRSLDNSPSS